MTDETTERHCTPCDYDDNPGRFLRGRRLLREYGLAGDVHEEVARRLIDARLGPVLDVGCGDGTLARLLAGSPVAWFGVDRSLTMLRLATAPRALATATALPFPPGAFGAVAALWMLYHLPDPRQAVAEAHRVLRPGGLFAASATSRHDLPELRPLLPPSPPSTFDAELAPGLLSERFDHVDVQAWDAPLVRLPDRDAVRRYLESRATDPAVAARAAAACPTPITVTKRGALVYAWKAA